MLHAAAAEEEEEEEEEEEGEGGDEEPAGVPPTRHEARVRQGPDVKPQLGREGRAANDQDVACAPRVAAHIEFVKLQRLRPLAWGLQVHGVLLPCAALKHELACCQACLRPKLLARRGEGGEKERTEGGDKEETFGGREDGRLNRVQRPSKYCSESTLR
ncbi:unnamed protein product [Prorocentrum cordatum]|uniref:Uncharacterized protein n=1 Tax=Prorocentrum cordatum TaxID=2364126 RepID=A0ABN9RYD9_9DINO|nr:unnamed protein product [Polarella glacialis]